MFKRTHVWLSGLLALQITVAAGLYWSSQSSQATDNQQPLLSVAAEHIDQITIEDGEGVVKLTKVDGHWLLPDQDRLPVDSKKVEALLEKAASLQTDWPAATTESAKKRFEVAEDDYQRKLTLFNGNELVSEWYLGTSPGFRQVHLRPAGEDRIYRIEMSNHELPVKNDAWVDKSLLATNNIVTVKGGDYALTKHNDGWQWVDQDDATSLPVLDTSKAEKLVKSLESLSIVSISDKLIEEPDARLSISNEEGRWDYAFREDNGEFLMTRSDRDTVFTIRKSDFESITAVNKPQLALEVDSKDDTAAQVNG